jgi:hypothetical protein
MDEAAAADNLAEFRKREEGVAVLPVCCLTQEGLTAVKNEIHRMVKAYTGENNPQA